MDRIALSDVDVFRLEREGCNANEIAAAVQVSVVFAAALMHRVRVLHSRAMESRRPGVLHMPERRAG